MHRKTELHLVLQGFDHDVVSGKLSTVWSILGNSKLVKQQQAQPHRAQVGLYCPKVAVMLEGGATDSLPAHFEVAVQELSAKFQSGSQTGTAGPVALQVHGLYISWHISALRCSRICKQY